MWEVLQRKKNFKSLVSYVLSLWMSSVTDAQLDYAHCKPVINTDICLSHSLEGCRAAGLERELQGWRAAGLEGWRPGGLESCRTGGPALESQCLAAMLDLRAPIPKWYGDFRWARTSAKDHRCQRVSKAISSKASTETGPLFWEIMLTFPGIKPLRWKSTLYKFPYFKLFLFHKENS